MARASFWVREPTVDHFWPAPPSTIWNQSMARVWPEGETVIRIFGNLRFWVDSAGAAISNPNDLYINYLWALVWDDGTVPNMNTMRLSANMDVLEEHILHMESFSMTDAHTPPNFNGVNIGFIDDRADTYFETRARRRSTPVGGRTASSIRFLSNAAFRSDFFGINYAPRLSINVLTLEASTV